MLTQSASATAPGYAFPAELVRSGDIIHGRFRDFPAINVSGPNATEVLDDLSVAISDAVKALLDEGLEPPRPSGARPGEHLIGLRLAVALRLSLARATTIT